MVINTKTHLFLCVRARVRCVSSLWRVGTWGAGEVYTAVYGVRWSSGGYRRVERARPAASRAECGDN